MFVIAFCNLLKVIFESMFCAGFISPVPLNKHVNKCGISLNLIELLLSKRVFFVLRDGIRCDIRIRKWFYYFPYVRK
jgi:hypothetical protein